ncbi:hypothetical protein TNCV_2517991 [Trichonephila clavipes]|nr:hypothetical protein TNCV_2517991 [Trichonephila clavipes]
MCLNEEIVQLVSHTQIAFEHCCLVKSCCDASCKKQKCVPARLGFDKGRITAYQDCSLLYHSTAAHIGRDPMIVSRIWN